MKIFKLVIVDDEKIIRETIKNFIDWESLNIEVVATCSNGIDAYDTIIDLYPDIVLVDIQMPGLTGLELISKLKSIADNDIEFIILSGFEEFSYATEAMKYGVRHYLTKPCNENEIISAVLDSIERQKEKLIIKEKSVPQFMEKNLVKNIMLECLTDFEDIDRIASTYSPYIDFENKAYRLFFIYFLDLSSLEEYKLKLDAYFKGNTNISINALYVTNTLIIFFREDFIEQNSFYKHLTSINIEKQEPKLMFDNKRFPSLKELFSFIIPKIKRFSTVSYVENTSIFPVYNYNSVLEQTLGLITKLNTKDKNEHDSYIKELLDVFYSITDLQFLIAVLANALTKPRENGTLHNAVVATDFLLKIQNITDINEVYKELMVNIPVIFKFTGEINTVNTKDFVSSIMKYVTVNLHQSDLSLKWIAENILFMNVDYVSKQFVKQTGQTFSSFLNQCRIERAKVLLLECHGDGIQIIAERVGCGNNPQYFSQWFKKHTGVSPSKYIGK